MITVARTGPISAISLKKTTNASAVQIDRQREHRDADLPPRDAVGQRERRERRVDQRCDADRGGDHAERRRVAQPAREHDRADRVTDRDDRDLGQRHRAGAVHVEPDDRRDTDASRRSSPAQRRAPCRSRSPVSVVTTAPTSGTAAIRSPVSELVSSVSARARKNHGITISITAKTSDRQPAARERPQLSAHRRDRQQQRARRSRAAEAERDRARARARRRGSGGTGIPQITHIAAKSSQPRRVMRPLYQPRSPNGRHALEADAREPSRRRRSSRRARRRPAGCARAARGAGTCARSPRSPRA